MKYRAILYRLTFLIFIGCLLIRATQTRAADTDSVAKKIFDSPSWNYAAYEKGEDEKVIAAIGLLSTLSTGECRNVVRELMAMRDLSPTRNKWFKVMILNRLIFDVPDEFKRADFGAPIGGWRHPSGNYNDALLSWPLIKKDGFFRIASRSAGYSGADYDGLREFDAFAAKFKRRAANGDAAKNW